MDVLRASLKRPRRDVETECLFDVRANIFSVGGALISSVCVMLTVFTLFVITASPASTTQRLIAVILMIASWFYFLSSATERLALVDHSVEYTAALSSAKRIPLAELEEMLLVHQGFNLERGIVTIEFRRRGKKIDRVALGPCWQRHKLEGFLHSVEEALNAPEMLEEVR